MTPESGEELEGDISFTLIQDKIFKDQVSFDVRSTGVYDEMSLKVHPSRLEIKFFPESSDCRRDTSIGEVCSKVREMGTSISKAFRSLHYNEKNLQPVMCLMCGHCSEPHPVEKAKQHYKIHCKSSRRTGRIPVEGRCWFNEGMYWEAAHQGTIFVTISIIANFNCIVCLFVSQTWMTLPLQVPPFPPPLPLPPPPLPLPPPPLPLQDLQKVTNS